MKRTLLIGVVMLMAFAAVFIGCQDAYELNGNVTETIPSLSGPDNLTAKAYPGVNLLTWNLNKDAKSYTVFRRDTVTRIVTKLAATSIGETGFKDIVSFDNQLIDKRNYEYTVTANSSQSTSGRKSVDNDAVIFDGASSVSVTADIPARTVAAADSPVKLKAEDLTVGKWVNHDSSEQLEVLWTVAEDSFSSYKVEYLYGDGTLPVPGDSDLNVIGTRVKRATAPLIGGPTTVKVTAYWDDNDYYAPVPAIKSYPGVLTTLPKVTGFNVANTTGNVYTLTWTDVIGATDYEVWKAPVTIGTVNGESWIDSSWTLGAWTQVTTTAKTKNGPSAWTLLETGVDTTKAYVYIILAKNTTAKSSSPATKATAPTTQVDTTTTSFTATPTTAPGGTPQITISWTKATDETYALTRAEVTYDTDDTTILLIGTYSTPAFTLVTNQTSQVTYIDAPTLRHSYIYNLKVTKTNGSVRNVTQEVKAAPYSSLNVSASISARASSTSVYSTDVTVNVSGAGNYTADLSAEIFQATYDTNTSKENSTWTSKGTLTAAQLGAGTALTVSGLTPDQYYVYRAKITSGTGTAVVLTNTSSSYRTKPSYGFTLTSYNPTVTVSSNSLATAEIALTLDSNVNDTTTLLKDAEVWVRRWDNTARKYIYTTLPNKVAYTSTGRTGTGVATVLAKSYYIRFTASTIPLPSTAAAGWYYYDLVTPNNDVRDDSSGQGFTHWGDWNFISTSVTGNPISSRTVTVDSETITW
jgi:hypothetical protein